MPSYSKPINPNEEFEQLLYKDKSLADQSLADQSLADESLADESLGDQSNGVSEWSHHVINTFSLMNKTKFHAKKAFVIFEEYINKNNINLSTINLSDEMTHNIKMLSNVWSNDDKFNLEEFLSIVETYTNNLSETFSSNNLIDNTTDLNILNKLWTIYYSFTQKTLETTKEIQKIHKENINKVNLTI